jgi:hypothetical protein
MSEGKIFKTNKEKKFIKLHHKKLESILSKECPAIMFANNLIDKLATLAKYEIISIITRRGVSINGVPAGKNKEKDLVLFIKQPLKFKPKKDIKLKKKVTIK